VLLDQSSENRVLRTLAERGELRQYDVVHLAGHTLTDSAPEGCAVVLSADAAASEEDDLLQVEDILLRWDLDASLLTLSGCQTLRPAGAARQDPLGFLPALFGSGARRVLSSLWTVDDRATAVLMDRFYQNLTGGSPMPPARALREAKHYVRTVTDAQGRRPFEHPAYWAGFVLVGLP
jgi:CHAT domain-containing protein